MKYTYCERLMWHIPAPASFRFLSEEGWDVSNLKKKAKAIYRQIVARTPGIGGLTGNSLHICLVAGMIWLFIEWMGGKLCRTKTLAASGDCCDFYICKKGSKWDGEHNSGGLSC